MNETCSMTQVSVKMRGEEEPLKTQGYVTVFPYVKRNFIPPVDHTQDSIQDGLETRV